MDNYIPSLPAIVREAICVAAGALLAVAVVRMFPEGVQDFFSLQKREKK